MQPVFVFVCVRVCVCSRLKYHCQSADCEDNFMKKKKKNNKQSREEIRYIPKHKFHLILYRKNRVDQASEFKQGRRKKESH